MSAPITLDLAKAVETNYILLQNAGELKLWYVITEFFCLYQAHTSSSFTYNKQIDMAIYLSSLQFG
jgi:hypothetical protein